MITPKYSLIERIILAIVALAGEGDRHVRRVYVDRSASSTLMWYADSVIQNPNQTQMAQRIYARAIADRIDGL